MRHENMEDRKYVLSRISYRYSLSGHFIDELKEVYFRRGVLGSWSAVRKERAQTMSIEDAYAVVDAYLNSIFARYIGSYIWCGTPGQQSELVAVIELVSGTLSRNIWIEEYRIIEAL